MTQERTGPTKMTPLDRLRPATLILLAAWAPAQTDEPQPQEKALPAYPGNDILSPFRAPDTPYAPPDSVYRELRAMRAIVESGAGSTSFDDRGREICDSEAWRAAHERLAKLFIDPGYLAQIIRLSNSADDRATAFYGAFFCADPSHVLNLIAHIPGEPLATTREQSYPRAIAYLRTNIGRRYGDLTDEQKKALNLPEPGSPAAQARGITRAPKDDDFLFGLNLKPFFQLLDLDSDTDQAQGLWFLKECFRLRADLIDLWLERALPRLRQLLSSRNRQVRSEVLELLAVIDPERRQLPDAAADSEAALAWAEDVMHTRFPPVRRVSPGLLRLQPSKDRDAIATAALELMERNAIGEPANGRLKDGQYYRGFRVGRTPEPLDQLGIPVGAVITTINGQPINDGPGLVAMVKRFVDAGSGLMVEYVLKGQQHAMEFRFR